METSGEPAHRTTGVERTIGAGYGLYPVLSVLGIHQRLTPAYASLLTREVIKGSLDEAQVTLASRGVHRNRKAIHRSAGAEERAGAAQDGREDVRRRLEGAARDRHLRTGREGKVQLAPCPGTFSALDREEASTV